MVLKAEDQYPVPVVATFLGLKFLPWWLGFAYNNAGPVLSISKGAIRYRVLRLRVRPLSDVEKVDLRTAWRTVNLCFAFQGSATTFTANVRDLPSAAVALRRLPVEILSHRAQQVRSMRLPSA